MRRLAMRDLGFRTGGPASPSARVAALLGADRLAHWDATALSSISLSGSAVTGLRELVGGTVYVPGIASTRPAYSATGFNGRPCLVADGVDDYLFASEVPWPAGASASEIWACVSQDVLGSAAGSSQIVGYGSTATINTTRAISRISSSSVNRARAVVGIGASAPQAIDSSTDFSGFHVIRGVFGASSTSISIDGGPPTSVSAVPATDTSRTALLAAMGLINGFFTGKFSVGLVTNPLSADKAEALLALLQQRYL